MVVSPSLWSMAISAETLPGDPPRMGIHVGVAIIAGRAGVGMPRAMILRAGKARGMSLWIRTANAVCIDMARDAHRVSPACIMTGHAAFNIAPSQLRMASAPGADSKSREPRSDMRSGDLARGQAIALGMATRAEILRRMASEAVR